MSELGVFGLTIPEEYGALAGQGIDVRRSEALSRGYIGVGSLGTARRSRQSSFSIPAPVRRRAVASQDRAGEILPTAVFTEPNTGSDLAALKTRAVRDADSYKVFGNTTWSPIQSAPI